MPRPARSIWVPRTYARRRHRSWMVSMTLASLGWGVWWIVFFLRRLVPALDPGWVLPSVLSTTFAVLGLCVAFLTVRAQRSWMLFVAIPMLANASLLVLPWLVKELREAP